MRNCEGLIKLPELPIGMINGSVVLVGAGAIGSAVAGILAKAEVKRMTIIDRDFVERSNLQHQLLFTERDVGMPKATAAKAHLGKFYSKIKISAVVADLDYRNVNLLSSHDIVLDCTDNFETRFLINDYCRKSSVPWIYAAVIRDTGTAYCVTPDRACFRCIFSNHSAAETCDTAGVLNSTVAATASLQASEAVKILLKSDFEKDMARIKPQQTLKVKVKKRKGCICCNGNYEYLSGKKGSRIVKLCGTGTYQIKGKPVDLGLLRKRFDKAKPFGCCIHLGNITIFSDGRAIVKAESAAKAKSAYARIVG